MNQPEVLAAAVIELFEHWQVPNRIAISILGGRHEIAERIHDRIIILMCINRALARIYSDPRDIGRWINSPNATFAGLSPLETMEQGDIASLKRINAYLMAETNA